MSGARHINGPQHGGWEQQAPNETPIYRVVSLANPQVSPFPDHTWTTRWQAEKFAHESAPNGWNGKLLVVDNQAKQKQNPTEVKAA